MLRSRVLMAAALSLCAGSVFAHPGNADAGFASGLMHPVTGLDHLLVMLAVGLYAAGQRGTARWGLPLAFVLAMLSGSLLAMAGVALPAIETTIAASVVVLGLLLVSLGNLPLAFTLPLITIFAVFHGHAHYAEMGDAGFLRYAAGFVLATAGLHLAGFLSARWLPESRAGLALKRGIGVAVSGAGMMMLGS